MCRHRTIFTLLFVPVAGSRQPWYAKMFAPAPDGTDSITSTAHAGAGSQQTPEATQAGAAAHPMPLATAHSGASTEAAPAVAAADLGSALEAFMGIDEEEGGGQTTAPPSAVSSRLSASSFADVPQPAAAQASPAAPASPPKPARTNGYAALADGYLGATAPVHAATLAAPTSTLR